MKLPLSHLKKQIRQRKRLFTSERSNLEQKSVPLISSQRAMACRLINTEDSSKFSDAIVNGISVGTKG